MESRYVEDLNVGSRQNVKLGTQLSQNGYSTFLFTAMTHKNWVETLQKGFGIYLYLGTLGGLAVFKAGLYLYDLIQSKNKNLEKVGSFLRELLCAAIAIAAVIGGLGLSTILAVASPWLMVSGLLVNTLYNLSIGIQNGYKWATEKDDDAREKYKASFKQHMFITVISAIATTGVALLMLTEIAPVAIAIFNACFNAFGFALGVHTAVKNHRAKKNQPQPVTKFEVVKEPVDNPTDNSKRLEAKEPLKEASFQVNTLGPKIFPIQNKPRITNNSYFYSQNIPQRLLQHPDPRNYLLHEIAAKITDLHDQIDVDRGKLFSQATKRWAKILSLTKLKNLVEDSSKTLDDFYLLLKEPEFNNFFNNPFQSFYRDKSATQQLFTATENLYVSLKQVDSLTLKSF